jgi:hypothetical protein
MGPPDGAGAQLTAALAGILVPTYVQAPAAALGFGHDLHGQQQEETMRVITVAKALVFAGVLASCGTILQSHAQAPTGGDDPAALRAEIEHLKSIAPSQGVAMTEVAYNFNNLWFAAQAGNWPLAQFYFGDTRGRLRWALRIVPVRKISTGQLELQPFLDSLEKQQLTKLGEAITAKNLPQFETAYKAALEGCHACHTASEKPYLDVQVPTAPAEPMIHFAPR